MKIETYAPEIPQCLDAASAAFSNRESPTSDTVGTIVSGVTNRNSIPITPENKLIQLVDI